MAKPINGRNFAADIEKQLNDVKEFHERIMSGGEPAREGPLKSEVDAMQEMKKWQAQMFSRDDLAKCFGRDPSIKDVLLHVYSAQQTAVDAMNRLGDIADRLRQAMQEAGIDPATPDQDVGFLFAQVLVLLKKEREDNANLRKMLDEARDDRNKVVSSYNLLMAHVEGMKQAIRRAADTLDRETRNWR
jgi:hypothetical protein